MGLPVERLIVATNVNDILHRALSSGDYSKGQVQATATPSMDIQVSSNFERLLFDANGRDGAALASQMKGFEGTGAMRLTNAQSQAIAPLFTSTRVDADDMSRAMRWAHDEAGQVLDPHTAIALSPRAPPRRAHRSSRSPPRTRPSSPMRSSARPASARPFRAASATCSSARNASPPCPPPSTR